MTLWTRQYISILCSTLLAYIAFQMLIPTITVYVQTLHGTTLGASLAYSASAFSALGARGLSGTAMDRIGRKPILLIGMTVLVVTDLLLYVAPTVTTICIVRFCQGIGWGMVSTALATIVSDLVPEKRMGEGIGYFALVIVLASSLSVIVGIWVMNQTSFTVVLTLSTLFFATAGVLSLLTGVVPFRKHDGQASDQSFWSSLFEKNAVFPAFLCFLHSVAFSGIMTFIMLFGTERGIDDVYIFFAGHVLMVMVSRPFAGRLYDRRGHGVVVIPGVISMIIGMVLLSYARGEGLLVVASLFYGLGFGTVQPSLQAWAIGASPSHRRGAANGTFLSSLDLGFAVGAIVTGLVATATSYAIMYRLSSLLLIAVLALYGIYMMTRTRRQESVHP